MLVIDIPGREAMNIQHLVLDYNGTIAFDGKLITGVLERMLKLSGSLRIHVLTADTFGGARIELAGAPCEVAIIAPDKQDEAKADFVRELGAGQCVCIGNGANDHLMLKEAALGIAVIQEEGAACKAVGAADVVCTSINNALDLLVNPKRLTATLRI